MKYNVLKITTIMPAMLIVMIVTLLMVACSDPDSSGSAPNQEKDEDTMPVGMGDTDTPPVATVLKTLSAPGVVTAPLPAADTPDKGKLTVTAIAPTLLGTKVDGKSVGAEEIKYALYYTRFGHGKGDITIGGGTPIADIAKAAGTTANGDAGIVRITGNTLLTTTGFAIPDLSKDTIYRYFIRSIHPDNENKYTDTVVRLAFVLNPDTTKKVKVIPDSVTSIGAKAFESKVLTSVFIPDSVTSIGAKAFYVNALTSVMIPKSVTSIGDMAFSYNKLMSVTIGNKVKSIGDMAFSYNKLMSITIGNSVMNIGRGAFADNKLMSVMIPKSVTSIGIQAFANNAGLTSVTLSKTLYDAISSERNLDNIFGSGVTTYQDHAKTKLN